MLSPRVFYQKDGNLSGKWCQDLTDDSSHKTEYARFSTLVYRSLLSHKAPVLERLHLKLDSRCSPVDIGIWVEIAIDGRVRELDIKFLSSVTVGCIRLPSSIYTSTTLETLKLEGYILVDVPSPFCFPSLKSLHLINVDYKDDESVSRLLSSCSVLEHLVVERYPNDNVITFTIAVPSLQRLSICNNYERDGGGYVINSPSLKYLNIVNRVRSDFYKVKHIPELVEANAVTFPSNCMNLLRSLTSVKRLSLCLSPLEMRSDIERENWLHVMQLFTISLVWHLRRYAFHRLVHLELCTCIKQWVHLLMRMLEVSPKLRFLKLKKEHDVCDGVSLYHWYRPVPECISVRLETFEWIQYEGTLQEKEVAIYILMNARRLKLATISPKSTSSDEKLRMLKELASVARVSTDCQLVFN